MEALVVGGFKTAIDRKPPGVDGHADMYDIAHSEQLVLIDDDGGVRGFYAVRRPKGAPAEPCPWACTATPEAEALGLDAVARRALPPLDPRPPRPPHPRARRLQPLKPPPGPGLNIRINASQRPAARGK
jgi:hypothetical protein